MSKVFQGTTTNNVTELTLQEEGGNIGTQTIVWDSTQGTIDQVIGDIPDSWKNGDSSLKQLQIGSSCTSIGNSAFRECTGLTGSLVIPDSVTTIGDFTFRNCDFTGSLTIPDSVTTIKFQAFYSCTNLTGSITIGNNVIQIRSQAFAYCGVNTLYTNADVASWIGIGGLAGTFSLTTIYVGPDAVGTYTSTFQQGSGMTVLPWDNYPNPIPN
jgi:hypothetical protein